MTKVPLAVRIDPGLKARVVVVAAERGQKITTFVERALESALTGPLGREAEGLGLREPGSGVAGLSPVPSASSRASKHNVRPVDLPGVKTARQLALERQARLNKPREKS